MPKKLPDNFVNERYRKEEKFIFVYDTYTPNYKKTKITRKFYSNYEGRDEEANPAMLHNLQRAKDWGPKLKLTWPETTNQKYGWFTTPLVDIDRNDNRLYFPRTSTELTQHGLMMLQTKKKK